MAEAKLSRAWPRLPRMFPNPCRSATAPASSPCNWAPSAPCRSTVTRAANSSNMWTTCRPMPARSRRTGSSRRLMADPRTSYTPGLAAFCAVCRAWPSPSTSPTVVCIALAVDSVAAYRAWKCCWTFCAPCAATASPAPKATAAGIATARNSADPATTQCATVRKLFPNSHHGRHAAPAAAPEAAAARSTTSREPARPDDSPDSTRDVPIRSARGFGLALEPLGHYPAGPRQQGVLLGEGPGKSPPATGRRRTACPQQRPGRPPPWRLRRHRWPRPRRCPRSCRAARRWPSAGPGRTPSSWRPPPPPYQRPWPWPPGRLRTRLRPKPHLRGSVAGRALGHPRPGVIVRA